jgi:DNA-binding GntR family transcriptional regulator
MDAGLTQLQAHVMREILAQARRDNLKAGEHLAESVLADRLGTSRSPVNAALRHLVQLGALMHDLNRGYFLTKDAASLVDLARRLSAQPDDPLYVAIASDRLARKLPDEVNEADLMRTYEVSRCVLRKILSRIQQEGWIEKSRGHGWQFLPMIDSPQAYEESYMYRAAIEPMGLMSPALQIDPLELASLRRQQLYIVEGGFKTMTPIELFESNGQFHETLARWSGNRFIQQGVRRTNQLRRLVEYRQAARDRGPRRTQAQEHLGILEALAVNDQLRAASLLRAHIEGARQGKSYGADVFAAA